MCGLNRRGTGRTTGSSSVVTNTIEGLLNRAFLFCRDAMKRPIPNVPNDNPRRNIPWNLCSPSFFVEDMTQNRRVDFAQNVGFFTRYFLSSSHVCCRQRTSDLYGGSWTMYGMTMKIPTS